MQKKSAIKDLRNMNEHMKNHITGVDVEGHDRWFHTDGTRTTDAITTEGVRIGGRLDWIELSAVAARLLEKLNMIDPALASANRIIDQK
jgi:hypothetical protein